MEKVEKLLKDKGPVTRYVPRTVLFDRNGEFALLLDDKQDDEAGIAVVLSPTARVVDQNEYL